MDSRKGQFVPPPLAFQLRGVTGCRFQEATFDHAVGTEVYLAIFEQGRFAHDLAGLSNFHLFCKTGVARTAHGLMALALFTVYDDEQYISAYELFLNPYEGDTLRLLSCAGSQSHFKVVIYGSVQGRLVQLLEFENVYMFDEFAAGLTRAVGQEPYRDFQKAQKEFMERYSMEDLLKIREGFFDGNFQQSIWREPHHS